MAVRSIAAKRLTDTQLVSAQFRYTDPENSIAGLNRSVPDREAHPTIIGFYDDTPAGDNLRRQLSDIGDRPQIIDPVQVAALIQRQEPGP